MKKRTRVGWSLVRVRTWPRKTIRHVIVYGGGFSSSGRPRCRTLCGLDPNGGLLCGEVTRAPRMDLCATCRKRMRGRLGLAARVRWEAA